MALENGVASFPRPASHGLREPSRAEPAFEIRGLGHALKAECGIGTVTFLGNFVPRRCGIATFTADLHRALSQRVPRCFVVPVNDAKARYEYPAAVRFEIEEQDLSSYRRAADFINSTGADAVSVQHEFGIFGGEAGSHLLVLLRELAAPVVPTLHTVLDKPNPGQRRVMENLIDLSARLIVMTERGRAILENVYRAPRDKIDVIPHGIPDTAFGTPDACKQQINAMGATVLLTFGLLSPNKGIEHVINALPRIVAEFPDVVYLVLGATHPHELRANGEAYRRGLEALAKNNGVANNVIFHNRFVDQTELIEFLGAADIYITPYLFEAQVTSGALAYAFGSGKAVISTPYWHAAELLRDQRGILVPFANPEAIAREAVGLLRDDTRRAAISARAYRLGRDMVWSKTAALYLSSFERARSQQWAARGSAKYSRSRTTDSVDFKFDHLLNMTDSTGIFQHATLTVPNLSEGYCTDDNARALIAAVLCGESVADTAGLRELAATYSQFLQDAFEPAGGRFRNFRDSAGAWLDSVGSEDCHGRALWALGTALGRARGEPAPKMEQLFAAALPAALGFTSPRAWAFTLIGIHEYLQGKGPGQLAMIVRNELTKRLVAAFDQASQPGWTWFEDGLAYDNAKLAHALIVSGNETGQWDVFDRGMRALRWLVVAMQTSPSGQFRPIGSNGFHRRNGPRADFDQQPIEAQATVSACLEAYRITSDRWWHEYAQRSFDWFLGWNDLGLDLYDRHSGGCRDGLHSDRCNENQGAESTLAFLLSLAEMRVTK